MIYIYDILLNFNENLIEFFNWEDEDNIKYIKKIPLFKVSTSFIKDIIYNDIEIDSLFLESIKNKCLFFDETKNYNYVCLFSDGNISMGVNFTNDRVKEVSRMLLDEEEEILNVVGHINNIKINYQKLGKLNRNINISSKDLLILNKLKEEFDYLYRENKVEKLNYYYYEYFNKVCNDKDKTYNELNKTLNSINDKHRKLYKIIELSYQNKD